MGWFSSSAYEEHLESRNKELICEIKGLKAQIKFLESVENPCNRINYSKGRSRLDLYSRLHFSDSDEICRLRDLLTEALDERDYFRNTSEERRIKIRDLEHRISEIGNKSEENRLRRTLEQCSKDAREDKAEIQRLNYEMYGRKDKITAQSKRINELENELKMYKDFFAGNEVKVFLKDKEVKID